MSPRREGTRLSENPQGPLSYYSSSRLGEEGLAWARGSLAWARSSSLSETGEGFMLWCEWPTDMVACCMNWEAWDVWFFVYAWCWYYGNFLIDWWNMYKVWVGRNSMTLVVRAHGGSPPNGHNSMGPPRGSPWWCPHLLDLIPWTSRWEFMVVPQRQDVIPRE